MSGARMELHELDLNLLVVFTRVLTERRVSKVAESLGVSQPAVSNSLAKLRRHFGDELFLRTANGMEPTPFAEQLAESVNHALSMIHSGINQRSSFEPASAQRAVTIGMTDIGEIYFLPALIERLHREAPGVTLSTVRNTAVNLRDELESGKVDLALGLLPQLKAGFFQRRLFMQRYVCLLRRGHRLDKRRVSVAEFAAAEHLVVVSAGTGHGKVDELLERSGVRRHVRLTVPHYVGVGHILSSTDLIATVPERLDDRLIEPFGLA
jgi:DNA-binding transcriptional LysR family regulator